MVKSLRAPVHLVVGMLRNIKLTKPEELALVAALKEVQER